MLAFATLTWLWSSLTNSNVCRIYVLGLFLACGSLTMSLLIVPNFNGYPFVVVGTVTCFLFYTLSSSTLMLLLFLKTSLSFTLSPLVKIFGQAKAFLLICLPIPQTSTLNPSQFRLSVCGIIFLNISDVLRRPSHLKCVSKRIICPLSPLPDYYIFPFSHYYYSDKYYVYISLFIIIYYV